jgi:hypothetical protein
MISRPAPRSNSRRLGLISTPLKVWPVQEPSIHPAPPSQPLQGAKTMASMPAQRGLTSLGRFKSFRHTHTASSPASPRARDTFQKSRLGEMQLLLLLLPL